MHNFLFNIIKIQYLGKIIMETPESSSDGHMEAYIQQWADCNLTDIEGIHPERERERPTAVGALQAPPRYSST